MRNDTLGEVREGVLRHRVERAGRVLVGRDQLKRRARGKSSDNLDRREKEASQRRVLGQDDVMADERYETILGAWV